MEMRPLPFHAPMHEYEAQADALLAACRAGDDDAFRRVREYHPRLRDLPIESVSVDEVSGDDARLALARVYGFDDWDGLAAFAEEMTREGSPAARFEAAVEAVVAGDLKALRGLLRDDPALVQARSLRPHHATLLHYVAANGVEGFRQRTPPNAVEVAKALLEAGAEPDALAEMYDGRYPTMSMLVSSCHPADAGLQVALAETLLDHGAAIEGTEEGLWKSPLMTALAFGYGDTAAALARRGARADHLAAAAGLGDAEAAARLLSAADALTRHRALALAAQHGHADIVRLLLDAGESPDRYNPEGNHSHSVPLHQAVWASHGEVVRLLVERGARLDIPDLMYHGTPLDWAVYGERAEMEAILRERGAPAGHAG
ncbi:MAG TPA: ankyrin repeat domain-containing protein [Longimicrobium sp.]|nr:ankyrin repeat domain-containing protein [Longimicrobium sp.]